VTLRDLCPALANKTYFNYGGQGPLPEPSLDAMISSWRTIQELGPFSSSIWPYIDRELSRLRGLIASRCGVHPGRVAFTENVTSGCVLPLWGLPWETGDTILLSDAEHPGVVTACHELASREDLHVTAMSVSRWHGGRDDQHETEKHILDALRDALTANTRLVVLSHLLWNTGQEMPIPAVAALLADHPRQPWLLVDAAQSMGSLPVASSASSADIFAFTGHKWCCGPEGLGAVVLSERLLQQSRPTLIGWRSLRDEQAFSKGFHDDARRFEVATSCTPLITGLRTSLKLLDDEGTCDERTRQIQRLSGALWQSINRLDGLQPVLQGPPPAGLVSFRVEGHNPVAVVKLLGQQRVWLRHFDSPSCLRACTHITTSEEDLDRLISSLTQVVQGRGQDS